MNKQDLRNYAELSALLERRRLKLAEGFMQYRPELQHRNAADDAGELRAIASKLHRWSERQCNEDLTCPKCQGDGVQRSDNGDAQQACKACAGRGNRLGRREARAEDRAREIAAAYQMRAYFQGDPRGCPLYLIPLEAFPRVFPHAEGRPGFTSSYPTPESWAGSYYSSRGVAVCH